jgi:hypothetical protein
MKTQVKTLVAAVPLALMGSLFVGAAPAHADERVCRGAIGATSIDGDVVVPQGASCTLLGTRVDGNVKVYRNATLAVRGARIGGNIQADNHRRVIVTKRDGRRTRVGGSIQLKQGGGGKLIKVVVGSDIQLFSNDGRFKVRRNRVDGNLQCKSNRPAPVGGRNVVQGNKEDQCRRL